MDRRDTARDRRWWNSIDESKMTANVTVRTEDDCEEDKDVPIEFKVCPCCDGRGTHVNPNIDRHGLCREDFDNDPEFAEMYKSGMYDVVCYECEGRRVVPVCLDKEVQDKLNWRTRDLHEMRAEEEAERRAGA